MKETHQKVEIWTSQKPKKETRLKTRVNLCPRSHKERKRSASWKSVWIINSLFKPNYERRVSTFWEYDSRKIAELWDDTMCHSKWNYERILKRK